MLAFKSRTRDKKVASKPQKSTEILLKGVLTRTKSHVTLDSVDGPLVVRLPKGISPSSVLSGRLYYVRGRASRRTLTATKVSLADVPVPTASGLDQHRFAQVMSVLSQKRADLLAIPGVLDVRAGYLYVGGWTTHKPAIVVVYDPSKPKPPIQSPYSGVPVDLRPGTPLEELLATDAMTPDWVRDALLIEPVAVPGWELREQQGPLAAGLEAAAKKADSRLKYIPPPGVTLASITGTFDLLCHSSPDSGWPKLAEFLNRTSRTLTIGMYDFTAPHIAKAVSSASQLQALTLVLDPGEALGAPGTAKSKNPKAHDKHEVSIVKSLQEDFKRRFTFAWAAVKHAGKTNQGIFPSAYHIKVAVADSRGTWLSSGNWQSSNQPDMSELTNATANLQTIFKTFNREWHLIATNAALAKLFETFIKWDRTQAAKVQIHPFRLNLPPVQVTDDSPLAAALPQVHPPKKFSGRYTIQPLLTPDNYLERLRPLVEGTKHSLRIQNQYIKLPTRGGEAFIAFLKVLRDKGKALKENFKVIVRDLPGVQEQLEALEHFGFNMDQFKRQLNTHTKGVIIDEETLIIGSHNWSNQGVLENRDASLIITDRQVAGFYSELFDHDWQRLAHQTGSAAAENVSVSLDWSEYLS